MLRSYFPDPLTPPVIHPHKPNSGDECTVLVIRKSGQIEEWVGNVFMGTHPNLADAARFIGGRKGE